MKPSKARRISRGQGCVFLTVEPVAFEFYLGSEEENLQIKKEFLKEIGIDTVIPSRSIDTETVENLLLQYGKFAKGASVSYTDLILGAAIKKFPNSLLLSRNHRDFPTNIFECVGNFSFIYDREVRTYSLYRYGRTLSQPAEDVPF